ncbi:MAG: hypothetical protein IIV45_16750 [Lachnospiraceae bacterium]|nr:hypothetical protein [Lachnospiraceae bacterium]
MKNSKKCFLTATAAILIGMHAYNKFVETTATRKKMLSEEKGSFFDWKQGYIYYTKTGAGNPLLLVHDINSASSSEEWSKIIKRLSKNNTVYALDLLGCGRSEKPALKYTNYLYVQLITTFIKNVIKEPADVVATNLSSSVILSAAQSMGLDFIPVGDEWYEFAIPESFMELPHVQAFIEVLKSDAFKAELERLGGYGTERAGEIRWIN